IFRLLPRWETSAIAPPAGCPKRIISSASGVILAQLSRGPGSTKSIELSHPPSMGPGHLSSSVDAAAPSLRPSEQAVRNYQPSAAARVWSPYPSLHSPEFAPPLHGCASARDR